MTSLSSIYAGTPIDWLPVWLADVWRVFFWLAGALVLARLVYDVRDRSAHPSTKWGRLALILFIARALLIAGERWGDEAAWEGLPLLTVCIGFCWLSAWRYEPGRHRRASD